MRHSSPSKRLRIGLGTWVAIEAEGVANSDEQAAKETANAINDAYAAVSAVEARMHPTRPGSDLARINAAPLHVAIEIQPDTWQLLKFAQRLHTLTEGVFDPSLPDRPGRLGDIEIDPDAPMLICHAPVQLDLGGIAKGHAIDRAIERLIALGCTSGLVNAGGDLRVFGDRKEAILLRRGGRGGGSDGNSDASSSARQSFRPIALDNAALAVSDLDATEHPGEHQGYYNRVEPTASRRFAAVVAKDATTADALTKCVLLCSDSMTERLLREFEAQSV
jgi:thiamine biosynthesis lipoprotein